jgi:hypothetical protein
LPPGCTDAEIERQFGGSDAPCERCEIEEWLDRVTDCVYDALVTEGASGERILARRRWKGLIKRDWLLSVAGHLTMQKRVRDMLTGTVEEHVSDGRRFEPCSKHGPRREDDSE